MLYIAGDMNSTCIPDGARISFHAAFKLNAWALVAIFTSAFAHLFLRKFDLDSSIRAIIALAPLIPSFLYVRAIARWIANLDELQRQIQLSAWFFATAATIFVATALSLISASGLAHETKFQGGLGLEGTYAVALLSWMLGSVIATRRYQ